MKKRQQTHTIIASFFGMDAADVYSSRYQDTRTKTSIYTIDGDYYTVSNTTPTDEVGKPWTKIGEVDGRGIWESKAEGDESGYYSRKHL